MASRKIGAAECKAHFLRILDEVGRSGETVTITKRGRVVAELRRAGEPERRSIIGAMKGSVLRYDDPTAPAADPDDWHANR
jgi:antitoxin (DNA-binding transcriptional repressor) of toxin-antitoxin stability system